MMKRWLDIVAAGLGLLLLWPLLAIIALLVKCGSTGPVFFRHQRVGKGFRPFGVLKFRTMVPDAPQKGGPITFGEDPRITKIGKFLRKTKLDELPQLINVLVGDMSLVGPRPEVPKYVEMFHDDFVDVLSVRPGLTDPASLKYRDEAALLAASNDPEQEYVRRILPDKLALARDYISRATLASDLRLLVRTLLRIAS
jgi:lipopolysaccharide/colanic/teichoic acid biosynthesis glycosyltransferase